MRQFRVLPLVMLTASLVACGGGGGGAGQGGSSNTGPQGSIHNGGGSTPTLGTPCKTAGEQTGIPNGTAICKADASGALHWESYNPNNPNGGGSNAGGSNPSGSAPQSNQLRLGDACQTDGTFGYGDGMITICDKGKARYAVPTDMPSAPAGGYTKRPDWNPTLAEIFSPKVDECPNGKVTFGAPFLPLEHLTRTVPAGAMIAGHVTPIDHMYVGIDTLDREPSTLTDADYLPITAPADGWLIDVGSLGSPTSHRVVIVHGCGIVSVYMVINKLTGVLASVADSIDHGGRLEAPVPIKMGEEFGRQRDNSLDFNTFDARMWLPGFVNPLSYADGEAWKPYFSDPSKLFTPDIWSKIEATMQRTVAPRFGKIDHDLIGTASGSWFIDGTIGYDGLPITEVAAATSQIQSGAAAGKSIYSWSHLSMSPEPVDPSAWIFSTGSWSNPNGDPQQWMLVPGSAPAPDQLKAADGAVVYRLVQPTTIQPAGFSIRPGSKSPLGIGYTVKPGAKTIGWAVVQVIDDTHLAVETVVGDTQPTGFTAAKQTYHR